MACAPEDHVVARGVRTGQGMVLLMLLYRVSLQWRALVPAQISVSGSQARYCGWLWSHWHLDTVRCILTRLREPMFVRRYNYKMVTCLQSAAKDLGEIKSRSKPLHRARE